MFLELNAVFCLLHDGYRGRMDAYCTMPTVYQNCILRSDYLGRGECSTQYDWANSTHIGLYKSPRSCAIGFWKLMNEDSRAAAKATKDG